MQATIARIEVVPDLNALAPCHMVVEAIVEDLAVKRELFSKLEAIVGEPCILATNTSSLSVTAMAAACRHPGRVAGYHFFNPVPVLKIVEVVAGVRTEPWVTEALTALAKRFGHTPVRCQDTPGFIVNHAGRAFVPESLRVLSEGVADFATIDRILVDAAGFRLGPFGLMDLVGLDVAHAVMKSMYQQYYEEPKYRPSLPRRAARRRRPARAQDRARLVPLWKGRRRRGRAGSRSTGEEGSVGLGRSRAQGSFSLGAKSRPDASTVNFVAPLGKDATTAALELGLDPKRTVAVDPLFGFAKRRTLMTTPVTLPEVRDAAHALLAADGVPVSVINDSAGFVAQRVVAHIVNVGCDIVQMRIAAPEDLDRAVMLGLGYPQRPARHGRRARRRRNPRRARGHARVLPGAALPPQPLAQAPRGSRRFPAYPGVNPMLDAYIYDGLRTPIGRHAGKLAPVRPDDLAAEVIREVVARNKVDAERDQRRGARLRQPGRRRQPQRGALRRAARRPAADHARASP